MQCLWRKLNFTALVFMLFVWYFPLVLLSFLSLCVAVSNFLFRDVTGVEAVMSFCSRGVLGEKSNYTKKNKNSYMNKNRFLTMMRRRVLKNVTISIYRAGDCPGPPTRYPLLNLIPRRVWHLYEKGTRLTS